MPRALADALKRSQVPQTRCAVFACSSKKSPVAALPQYNDTHDDGVLSASAILATVSSVNT